MGPRRAAAAEARRKLIAGDRLSAVDRNVGLEVGHKWYDHSPTYKGSTGVLYDAEGVIVPSPGRSRSRKPSAVAGAHRFEAGVRKLLRSQGMTVVPAMDRDLDGIASVLLTDLARDAAMVVREARAGSNVSVRSPRWCRANRPHPRSPGSLLALGADLGQRALTEARDAAPDASAG